MTVLTKPDTGVAVAAFDLEGITSQLELLADWRDELRRMLAYALNNVWEEPDLDWLRSEVERFKLAVKGARR
jgi:hypothetical protein